MFFFLARLFLQKGTGSAPCLLPGAVVPGWKRASANFPLPSQVLNVTQPGYAGTVALNYDGTWILGVIYQHSSQLGEEDKVF